MTDPDGPPDALVEQWGRLTSEMAYLLRLAHTAGWRDGVDDAANVIAKQAQEYRSETATLEPGGGPYAVAVILGNAFGAMAQAMHARVLEVADPERPEGDN